MNSTQKQTICCPGCTYDANQIDATHCKICGTLLRSLPVVATNAIERRQQLLELPLTPQKPSLKILFPILALFLAIISGISLYKDNFAVKRASLIAQQQRDSVSDPKIKLYRSFQEVENIPRGLFRFGHSFATAPLHTPENMKELFAAHPNFELRYTEPPLYIKPGSSTSVAMLLDGSISFAELTRPLQDSEYAKAKERGTPLQQIPFALDGLAFFVDKDFPVDRLSVDQIRSILLGKITNWKQVGGPDLPIVPFTLDPQVAPAALSLLLEKSEMKKLSANVKFIRDNTDGIRQVVNTPGGISYASAAILINQHSVRPLLLAKPNSQKYISPFTNGRINSKAFREQTYPLMRRFFIAIRRDGSLDEQAGLAYTNLILSDQGQKLVEKAGFVRIR